MARFFFANTTWNSKGWTDPSRDRSGFKWVKNDPIRHVPGESWNFKPPSGKWKYGFFENLGRDVLNYEDGGVVFFVSKNHDDGNRYITGFYARATALTPRKRNGRVTSLKARWKDCLRLPEYLPFRPSRHLPKGTKTVRNLAYLKDWHAKNIFSDMLALSGNASHIAEGAAKRLATIANSYFPGIRPSALKLKKPKPSSADETKLKRFLNKDLPEITGSRTITLTKDNAKLRRSYRDHEALRRKVADLLKAHGYNVRTDKHLDLIALGKRIPIIVEVKSCRPDNIECQVRLGVAQLNYYGFHYRNRFKNARGMLAIQARPSDILIDFIVSHCGYSLIFEEGGALNWEQA